MRFYSRFKSTSDMMRSGTPVSLAYEYRNARDATEHDFHTDRNLRDYADLVYAYGKFTYGDRFLTHVGDMDREASSGLWKHNPQFS